MTTPIAINGRFLTRAGTGVDRVAEELVLAFEGMITRQDPAVEGLSFELLVPEGARDLPLRHVTQRRIGHRSGHAWEQMDLARATRGRWLLNFCNTGPALKRRSLVILHDAQIYQQPGSYSRAFRATYRLLLPLLGRRSRLVFTVSDFSRGELERYGVVPRGKIRVSPNGCDHMESIQPNESAVEALGLSGVPFVLALGSLSPHKNLKVLMAAARVGRRELPLLCIAGSANARIFAAAGLQANERVRFIGRVEDAALKALMQKADALLFPSLTEGFGLPPLEAMACGCPVVAAPAAAVREVCGDAALYADPHSPLEWLEAVARLRQDWDLRARQIEAGRAQAAHFTWNGSATRILGALRNEIAKTKAS